MKNRHDRFAARPVRLILADDHALVRDGIRARLESVDTVEVVGEAENGAEALELVERHKPDMAMIDFSMPVLNGLETAEKIRTRHPETQVLILSIYDNPEYVRGVLKVGANGYILKDISAHEMVNAITSVAGGGYYLSSKIAPSLISGDDGRSIPDPFGLTDREREILTAIARGMANKEIACALGISVRTVESHRLNIRDKVGGGNAAHLYRIAQDLQLI